MEAYEIIAAIDGASSTHELIKIVETHQDQINDAIENGPRSADMQDSLIRAAQRVSIFSLTGLILLGLKPRDKAEISDAA